MSPLKTIILIISFCAFSQMDAQTIRGSIKDIGGQPLPGCNVYLQNTFSGASSMSNGTFEFTADKADSAILVVEFIGYEDFRKSISLKKDVHIDITLKEAFSKLNAVTVTAGSYGTGDNDKTAVLNSLDVATTAGALADITGAMQTLPGTSTNGESGRLFVHGGNASETGTYIDGILVHQPYTSSAPNMAVRGRFNPFMFSGTSFSTGGYSAEYGQALSSVLLLNTKEKPEEDALNLGLMTIGLDAAGIKTWNTGAITVGANYMNLTPYMALVPQNYQWNKAPEAFGGQVSFRQQTKKEGLFKLYASADQSNLVQQQNIVGNPEVSQTIGLENKNRFVNANYRVRLSSKWMMRSGFSYTHNTDHYDLSDVQLKEQLKGVHAKVLALNEINAKTHLKMGVEYFQKDFNETYSLEGIGDSSVNFVDHKPAAFGELEVFLSNKFAFKAGGRVEHSSYLEQMNFSPRLTLAYQVNKNGQVSFAHGWFYQDPINKQLLGRAYLDYEKATHYTFSYAQKVGQRNLRAELYYKDYSRLVKYPSPNQKFTNDGNGYAYGFDLYFRDKKTIKNGDYWISYSWLQTERNYREFPTSATPDFTSAHNLSIVYKHWFSDLRSQLGVTFSYGSPRPHNNPNSATFMDEKLKPYRSLDMNWSFLFRENIIFHAAVSNVLGFQNSFGYNYSPIPDMNGNFSRTEILPAAKHFFFVGCFITLSRNGTKNQLEQIN
ncbi:MAG: TonB-dependent receptor [Schleiferiaceae bacterium]|nr:TonB-dependent receptor [Schleiferiaceae bacterium]